jgi:hypothetical protein
VALLLLAQALSYSLQAGVQALSPQHSPHGLGKESPDLGPYKGVQTPVLKKKKKI